MSLSVRTSRKNNRIYECPAIVRGSFAMPKKDGKQARAPVQLFPPAGWREEQLSRLRKFRPHKLKEVIREAKGLTKNKSVDAEVMLAFQRRNEDQVNQLVRIMGFDPVDPNIWRRAFFNLAMIHWGVGHLSWMPPRESNRRAAKWTAEHDSAFYVLMLELMAKGKGESEALRVLANDPKIWARFPKPKNDRSETPAHVRRFENFRKRWAQVKKTARPGSLLGAFFGSYPVHGSKADQAKWQPNLEGLPPLPLGKI
jgi:hypothetical protein